MGSMLEWALSLTIPGPPLGPSYLTTRTVFSFGLIEPDTSSLYRLSSRSKTMARPVKASPSLPVIFATAPPGARLPWRIRSGPLGRIGLLRGLMRSWVSSSTGAELTFCSRVRPVTVGRFPFNSPLAMRNLTTDGTPPVWEFQTVISIMQKRKEPKRRTHLSRKDLSSYISQTASSSQEVGSCLRPA